MASHPDSGSLISRPSMCRICVYGRMNPAWSDMFQGMTVTVVGTQDQATVSELCGQLPDQAALIGVLEQLHNFSIPVISVACIRVDSLDQNTAG